MSCKRSGTSSRVAGRRFSTRRSTSQPDGPAQPRREDALDAPVQLLAGLVVEPLPGAGVPTVVGGAHLGGEPDLPRGAVAVDHVLGAVAELQRDHVAGRIHLGLGKLPELLV